MIVAFLLFVVLLLPETSSSVGIARIERDLRRDGFRKMEISSFVDDIRSYIEHAVNQAKDDFNSTGKELYTEMKDKLESEVDEIFDLKTKEYLGQILLELPDSLTGAEIQSMFQDLIDFLKENEIDKLKNVAQNAVEDAGHKLDIFIRDDVKNKLVENVQASNKGNNKWQGKKKKPVNLVKIEKDNKAWNLNDVVVHIDGEVEKFKKEMVDLLKEESNEILIELDKSIEEVKDEFIKNMVSNFGSEHSNSNSEDPELKDVEVPIDMEIENSEADEDAKEEIEISEISEDSEDSEEDEENDAGPAAIELSLNAQNDIRTYWHEILKKETNKFKSDIEEVCMSTVEDLVPSATEEEKDMIVDETVEAVMDFNMKELEMGVQTAVDTCISNIEATVNEGGKLSDIDRKIMEEKIDCLKEIKDITIPFHDHIMTNTNLTVSKLMENVIEELGVGHD